MYSVARYQYGGSGGSGGTSARGSSSSSSSSSSSGSSSSGAGGGGKRRAGGLLLTLVAGVAWATTMYAAFRMGAVMTHSGASSRDWLGRLAGGGEGGAPGTGAGAGAGGMATLEQGGRGGTPQLPSQLRRAGAAPGPRVRARDAAGALGAFPTSVYDLAIVINVAPSEEQWQHNYRRIFSLWGAKVPYVYWVSNFTRGKPPHKPHAIQLDVPSVHDRYGLMLGVAWRVAPASVKWFITVDEDTYVFMENLLDALSHYDPTQPWYIGDISEDAQGLDWYTRMAYGGGGIAFSRSVVATLVGEHDFNLAACNARYERISTGDERLSRCVADLGLRLTRHPGFRQVDVRGDLRHVLQYVYSTAPLISLHHLYSSWPLFMADMTPLDAMDRMYASYDAHRHVHDLFLALHFVHVPAEGLTIAVNVGYSVRVWATMVRSAWFTKTVPEYGFSPWQPKLGSGYSFDSAPADPALVCAAAMFEWYPSAESPPGKPFKQTYRRVMTDGGCRPGDAPRVLHLLDAVVVTLVPCDSQPERVRLLGMSDTLMFLAVLDCRRAVMESYPNVIDAPPVVGGDDQRERASDSDGDGSSGGGGGGGGNNGDAGDENNGADGEGHHDGGGGDGDGHAGDDGNGTGGRDGNDSGGEPAGGGDNGDRGNGGR